MENLIRKIVIYSWFCCSFGRRAFFGGEKNQKAAAQTAADLYKCADFFLSVGIYKVFQNKKNQEENRRKW